MCNDLSPRHLCGGVDVRVIALPINSNGSFAPQPLSEPRNALPNCARWMRSPITDDVMGSPIFCVVPLVKFRQQINVSNRKALMIQLPTAVQSMEHEHNHRSDPSSASANTPSMMWRARDG